MTVEAPGHVTAFSHDTGWAEDEAEAIFPWPGERTRHATPDRGKSAPYDSKNKMAVLSCHITILMVRSAAASLPRQASIPPVNRGAASRHGHTTRSRRSTEVHEHCREAVFGVREIHRIRHSSCIPLQ